MAFTDHSDLFGSVHEDGLNLVLRHLMRQRPSLFNYATPEFHLRPELFCVEIDVDDRVKQAGDPTFTELEPLPILGAPLHLGINFCVQLTAAKIDFHRGQAISLPEEIGTLEQQRFSLMARANAGIDCPSQELIDELVPQIERHLLEQQELAVGEVEERPQPVRASLAARADVVATRGVKPLRGVVRIPPREVFVLPTRELGCFDLALYIVGHFEWGGVPGSQQQWLKVRLDGLELVDIQPRPLEDQIECYVKTVLKLGILPRVMVPMEKLVLDITATLAQRGLQLGKQVTLSPSAVPADVAHNPAVEDDQLKAFIKLSIA